MKQVQRSKKKIIITMTNEMMNSLKSRRAHALSHSNAMLRTLMKFNSTEIAQKKHTMLNFNRHFYHGFLIECNSGIYSSNNS